MYACPACGNKCISRWQKLKAADRIFPEKCKACLGEFYVPLKYTDIMSYRICIPGILIWAAVFYLHSGWPLVAFAPLFIWSVNLHLNCASLVSLQK